MKKITRKQALANIQYTFDDFFKTYFRASKEAIDETIDNTVFSGQKEKLKEAVYSAEYRAVLEQLDGESFRRYYEKVGEFAMAYEIDTRLFTDCTPAVVGDINEVLPECANIGEKLDLINGFTAEELRTEEISFDTKTTLIEDILECWSVNGDKENAINRIFVSLTAEDRQEFVKRIGTDRKLLNRLMQKVNGTQKDEMLAVLGEMFIQAGFVKEGTRINLDNGSKDKYEATYSNGKVHITVSKEQQGGMRDYRISKKSEHYVDALETVTLNYDNRQISVPALMLINSWKNKLATPEGLFYNYLGENIDWLELSQEEKDKYFSEFVMHYLPSGFFNAFVNPAQIVIMLLISGAFTILTGGTSIIAELGAAMAVAGVAMSVADATACLRGIIQAQKLRSEAKSMHEAKKAAKVMADCIAKLTVDVINVIFTLVKALKAKSNSNNIRKINNSNNTNTKKFTSWEDMKKAYKKNSGGVTQFVKDNKPKGSPNLKKWFENNGSVEIIENGNGNMVWKYITSKGDSVNYIDEKIVFPDIYKYTDPNISDFRIKQFTGSRSADKAAALEFLMEEGYDRIPRGYVLHHDYENGHFQLIREDIHRLFTHYGGLYYN